MNVDKLPGRIPAVMSDSTPVLRAGCEGGDSGIGIGREGGGGVGSPLLTPFGERGSPACADVHLRIWLRGMAFDYRATAVAAHYVVRDWERRRWCTIEFIQHAEGDRMPAARLPNERLFLGP